jgi:hypothetical protein
MNHTSESNPPISFWPLLLAIGLALLVSGVVTSLIVSLVGLLLLLAALVGWVQESRLFGQGEEDENEDEATHE